MDTEATLEILADDRRRRRAECQLFVDRLGPFDILSHWRSRADALIEVARAEWLAHVEEPRAGQANGAGQINRYIKEGLGWPDANLNRRGKDYRANGDFSWCGAFAAFCLSVVGLSASIRKRTLPSCYRLQRDLGETLRAVDLKVLQPGDLLIVQRLRGGKSWGDHITVVEDIDLEAGLAHTIEGNARGLLPDGTLGEGVVRRTRALTDEALRERCPVSGLRQTARAHRAYRFVDEDFADVARDAWPFVGPDSATSFAEAWR